MTAPDTIRAEHGPGRPDQVVLVRGQDAPLLRLDLPEALRGTARDEVARRWLQDRLGLDPATAVLCPWDPDARAGRWRRAIVADAARVADWRNTPGRAVLPDYLALPAARGHWTLSLAPDGSVLARLGPADGFAAAPRAAARMLRVALAAGPAPDAVWADAPIPAPVLDVLRDAGVAIATARPDALRVFGHGELAADLRQDATTHEERIAARIRPWALTAACTALAAGTFALLEARRIDRLDTGRAAFVAANEDLVRRHFVPEGPILDTRRQVVMALDAMGGGESGGSGGTFDPVVVLARAAPVVNRAGAVADRVETTGDGALRLVLRLPDIAAAARLNDAFAASGLRATLRGTEAGGGTVQGIFDLGAGAGAAP